MTWAKVLGCLSAILALLAAQAAPAEEVPAAVGRISYGPSPEPGAAICTGVLVAADLVLTAAHCVRGAIGTPETIRFEAGWSNGSLSGTRQGATVILAGEAEAQGLASLEEDVALVVLDAPLPAADFPPFRLSVPGPGPFTLVGFDRSAPDLPRTGLCRPLAKQPGLMALDCPVESGNSGAPLLEQDGETWRVVAVMVASAQGSPIRSWAVLPPAPLRLRIEDFGATGP
jgi:hypothetical protein